MSEIVNKISPHDAKREMEKDKSIILLDVRTPEEYKALRIPNSVNIPLIEINKIESVIKNKYTRIFIYCLSGVRSEIACRFLEKIGYKNTFDLGGINDWGYETES